MDHILSNRIKTGDNVVFGITGSGATIGTALYTFDDLPDRLRRIELRGQKPEKASVQSESRTAVSLLPHLPRAPRVRVESVGILPQGTGVKKQGTSSLLPSPADMINPHYLSTGQGPTASLVDVQDEAILYGKEALEMASAAAERCLAGSSYNRSDIDLLIYAGVYRDDFLCEPALASMVEGKLMMNDAIESQQDKKTFAFDVFNGAVGFLNACQAAIGMIQAKKMKSAMVVTAEIENNAETLPAELRGIQETGSAVILDASADGSTGFGNFVFKYFPDYVETFKAYTLQRSSKTTMHFDEDPDIETYYQECISAAVCELLSIEKLDLAQIKVILPPQISAQFITSLSAKMNISRDKFVDVARKDLFTSSLPYALEQIREQDLVKPGDIGLIITVGSGIQVGCATYYF
jgi:3-oxoacyl-[acyl-carrier-protein] synthase III